MPSSTAEMLFPPNMLTLATLLVDINYIPNPRTETLGDSFFFFFKFGEVCPWEGQQENVPRD